MYTEQTRERRREPISLSEVYQTEHPKVFKFIMPLWLLKQAWNERVEAAAAALLYSEWNC